MHISKCTHNFPLQLASPLNIFWVPEWLVRTWEMILVVLFLGCSSNTALPDSTKLIRQMVGRLVTCVCVCKGWVVGKWVMWWNTWQRWLGSPIVKYQYNVWFDVWFYVWISHVRCFILSIKSLFVFVFITFCPDESLNARKSFDNKNSTIKQIESESI